MRHAARLKSSLRLQRVLSLLRDGNWHSTRDIQNNAYVCAAGECVSELRAPVNNIPVECRYIDRQYRYRLIKNGVDQSPNKADQSPNKIIAGSTGWVALYGQ